MLLLLPMGPSIVLHSADGLAIAEISRHVELKPLAENVQEHGHDDGEMHEQSFGHVHGHDPADHSHNTVYFLSSASQVHFQMTKIWHSRTVENLRGRNLSGIERPPKAVTLS